MTQEVRSERDTIPPPPPSTVEITNADLLTAIAGFATEIRLEAHDRDERNQKRLDSIETMLRSALFNTARVHEEQKRQRLDIDDHTVELARLKCIIGDQKDTIDDHERRITALEQHLPSEPHGDTL